MREDEVATEGQDKLVKAVYLFAAGLSLLALVWWFS